MVNEPCCDKACLWDFQQFQTFCAATEDGQKFENSYLETKEARRKNEGADPVL